jgi:sugar/nucleoside kinase (ribokinase family)
MPLVPTCARLKLVHACDQCHSSRMSTASYRCHRKSCRNTEGEVDSLAWAKEACTILLGRGVKTAVITLGARGAVVMGHGVEGMQHVTGPKVDAAKVVDTAGTVPVF